MEEMHMPDPTLTERVQWVVKHYKFAAEDYGFDGEVTDEARRRLTRELVDNLLTAAEREKYAIKAIEAWVEHEFEFCVRVGAMEKVVGGDGETLYRKLRNLSRSEEEELDAERDVETFSVKPRTASVGESA
jgi:hypothetical protein